MPTRKKYPGVEKRTGPNPWQAAYRGPDGHERTKSFRTQAEAVTWRGKELSALADDLWIDPRAGNLTFGDFVEQWRKSQIHRPSTAALVESHLNKHVLPVFGHRPLATIRPSQIQAWVRGLSEELAPATVELVFRYVSMPFTAAVGDRLIARNPCAGVKLPKRPRPQVVPLATEEVLAVIDAMPAHLRCAAVLGAGAGLRQGEALGVTRDRVNFLRRQLVVDQQLLTVKGKAPYLGPPKTLSSVRTLPLPDFVLGELAQHMERYTPGPWGLLFTSPSGGPVPRNRFAETWRAAATRAGLPTSATFHDLRHYFASLLIAHGESVKTVQARLGHASASETLDTYSHLWPDSEDRTRRAIDEVLNAHAADKARTNEARAE